MVCLTSPPTFLKSSFNSAEETETRIASSPLRKTVALVNAPVEVMHMAMPLWEKEEIRNGYESEGSQY